LLAGCGDDGGGNPVRPGPGSPSSQFTGAFVSGFEAGLLSVSIPTTNLAPARRAAEAADTVVTASGVMSIDGGEVVTLAGTYNTAVDSLHLAGGAWTLAGLYYPTTSPPVLEGTMAGPNGAGLFACFPGNTDSVHVFCGKFESDAAPTAGRWNIIIAGATLGGLIAPEGAASAAGFSGLVTGSGTVRSLTFSSGDPGLNLSGSGEWDTNNGEVVGTWTTDGDSGSWSGESCLPGGGGPN
ncbi:MAG TPA: hypothetical protein VFT32_11155, partial [Candidatus Eisenbacteria bacterium]|nr:hypothetical protein [Candidatus Eisenbacteria bacterium]